MPTLEEYASDPDDMDLDLAVAPPPSATAKGKMPAMPPADLFPGGGAGGMGDMGPEPSVPKAVRILYDGSFGKVTDEAWTRCVRPLALLAALGSHEPILTFSAPMTQLGHRLPDLRRRQAAAAGRRTARQRQARPRVAPRRAHGQGVPHARVRGRVRGALRPVSLPLPERVLTKLSERAQPSKTHPKDWENPGRIKVQLKTAEGKPVNASIKNSASPLTLPLRPTCS